MSKPVRDRFDDVPRTSGRVGAHRAENPGGNGWMVLLWAVVAALVLLVAGIFGTLVVMGRISLFPETQQTATPAPEETGVVDMTYSVMILNATPDDGIDDDLRQTLIDEGWDGSIVFAVDGSTDDFPETTVYYVDAADEQAALGLADLIGGALVEQSDVYAGQNTTDVAQLTVVLGVDRTTPAPDAQESSEE
ncbi:LytR C-terminal domain-containing protein [Microbacterium sp. NPDC055903]